MSNMSKSHVMFHHPDSTVHINRDMNKDIDEDDILDEIL